MKVQEVYSFIDSFAPFASAMSFDNPGLLVGSGEEAVAAAVVALDIIPEVVKEAELLGAQLIVSHHPVIFSPLKRLLPGSAPYELARAGIAAICAHTNLDMAPEGVNTNLAKRLGLKNIRAMKEYAPGLPEALMGELETPLEPEAFAASVKANLGADGLRYTRGNRPVLTVGLCGGGGIDLLGDAVAAGCDAFVTGESKHNYLIEAASIPFTLVDAGHFATEDVVTEPLREKLSARFPEVLWIKSKALKNPAVYL